MILISIKNATRITYQSENDIVEAVWVKYLQSNFFCVLEPDYFFEAGTTPSVNTNIK